MGFTQIKRDGLHTNKAKWASHKYSQMGFYNRVGPLNTGKSCGVCFKIGGRGKENNKEGLGKGGKITFFKLHKQPACVVGNESNGSITPTDQSINMIWG